MVDVRKCLWVADRVLMKRHSKTAYSFAAALAIKVRVRVRARVRRGGRRRAHGPAYGRGGGSHA